MISIFVVTNKKTNQSYVGRTRNNLKVQWRKILDASKDNIDFPLYRDILKYGESAFFIEEYYSAETKNEADEVLKETLEYFDAQSMEGYRTSNIQIEYACNKQKKNNKNKLDNTFKIDNSEENSLNELLVKEKKKDETQSLNIDYERKNYASKLAMKADVNQQLKTIDTVVVEKDRKENKLDIIHLAIQKQKQKNIEYDTNLKNDEQLRLTTIVEEFLSRANKLKVSI